MAYEKLCGLLKLFVFLLYLRFALDFKSLLFDWQGVWHCVEVMQGNTFDNPIKFSSVPNLTKHAHIYFVLLCIMFHCNKITILS